jgi:predicted HicB family RNase H-like nuclease
MGDVTILHYDIPSELHRRAKVAAATQGVTLKAFVMAALEAAVTDRDVPKAKRARR